MNYDDPFVRSKAFMRCLLCEAAFTDGNAGYLRRHYRAFHLVSKDAAVTALMLAAEKAEAIVSDFHTNKEDESMNKDEALSTLRVFTEDESDTDHHEQADDVLCKLLSDLGCADVVKEYKQLERKF
jgi:hypothetical protein